MAIRYKNKEAEFYGHRTYYCDGPNHKGDRRRHMEGCPFELEHGYGSPLDGDSHHFCSFPCLKDWVSKAAAENPGY
jgi:hypothetical protein